MAKITKVTDFDPAKLDFQTLNCPVTGKTFLDANIVQDADTGMIVSFSHYPAGFMTVEHTHHECSHGIYVIKGTLRTNIGDIPAGHFVWFPKDEIMEHGAGDEDCDVLFFTNKPFEIDYLGKEEKY